MTANAQSVDELSGSCDVAACCAERFGERAHKDVDGVRWNIKVIANATSMRSNCPNGMCFIDEKEELNNQNISEAISN